ncbi:inositol monophosphatase [Streptomyces sp. B1866]|uniref:inositol monophosphatase family protein n=1 Tax=Streptomyces sp. B1866 TaxID=3075431 RepID=UPI002890136D|nr:inositol monophosphatase [Streptomyces sp. B1866]MDT3396382.1 inositol monophosphatase [Streptomyces sp. B1866]
MSTTPLSTTPRADLPTALAAAAREAGDLLLRTPRPAPVTTLGQARQVFDALEAPVVDLLRRRLDALRPGTPWTEELGTRVPTTGEAWVVDAIDGAVQFMRGLPQFCVSLALVRDGEPVAAALYAPLLGETYQAAAGHGATRDGRPVAPAAVADPAVAVVATSQPPFAADHPEAVRQAGRSLTAVLPAVAAVRNLGPTSWQIADTAAGRLDAFWQFGSDPANLLAGALIAREAGAVVTDAEGHPWQPSAPGFLAASPALHPTLLGLIAEPDPGSAVPTLDAALR